MKVTIKEIAELAGVSINTVSRALNGKEGVSKKTQAKVLQIAEELNYIPNQFAKGLKSKKSNLIGVVVTNVANPFYSEFVKVAEKTARKNGYHLILCNSDENAELENDLLKMLKSNRADGIIITPVRADHQTIEKLNDLNIPYVIANREPEEKRAVNFVINNNEEGGYIATKHLCERAVSEIHYIGGPSSLYTVRRRIFGCEKALKEHQEVGLHIHSIELTMQACYEKTQEIIETIGEKRIGIFAYNDNLAIGAMKAIMEAGLEIPNQVALVGYDDILIAQMLGIPLTTVHQSSSEMAEKSTSILMERMQSEEEMPYENVVFEPHLVVRSST